MKIKEFQESPELSAFKGPHLAVDSALMTVAPDQDGEFKLAVLVHKRSDGLAKGEWALIGRMVRERERLAEAVRISLQEKSGISSINPRQLFVSDEPTRDSRGWVVSVAHVASVKWETLSPYLESNSNLALAFIGKKNKFDFTLPEEQKYLPFEHDKILEEAVNDLRLRYEAKPDPDNFLPKEFTILELRKVHEAVLGRKLDKDLFRRKMQKYLKSLGKYSLGSVGKPAELFKRNP